jgi:hypothetical protein
LSRSQKFGQDDKWNFCLTTAIIAVNRGNQEQTTPAEPLAAFKAKVALAAVKGDRTIAHAF